VYGLAILDYNGPITDNNLLRALGWHTQTPANVCGQRTSCGSTFVPNASINCSCPLPTWCR
jgi:hypothetical protein